MGGRRQDLVLRAACARANQHGDALAGVEHRGGALDILLRGDHAGTLVAC